MAREVVVAPAPVVEHAWMLDAGDVVHLLGTDPEHGLSNVEAARRLAASGPNTLVEQAQPGPWRIFAASSPTR